MKFRKISKMFKVAGIVFGFGVIAVAAGTLFQLNGSRAAANDCSANAIMTCGAANPTDFINKLNANAQGDLQTIYAAYGLSPADYARFASSAKTGTALKDGTIVVDGTVVATNASSIGRSQKAHSTAKVIGGKTYWDDTAQNVFASNSIPVMVLFNGQGQMQFAVMFDCGNPTNGTVVTPPPPPPPPPPTPVAECKQLTAAALNRTTYRLTGSAIVSGGASVLGYDFTVKDAAGNVVASPTVNGDGLSTFVDVSLTNPGAYAAQLSVRTTVGAKANSGCMTNFTVAPPPVAECKQLVVTPLDRTTYKLDGSAAASGGASVLGYVFTVTDSTGKVVVTKQVDGNGLTTAVNVTVENAGTYHVALVVRTSVGDKTSTTACVATFTVPEKPVPPKPSIRITKTVDGVKFKQVAVGQSFVYQVTVTNDGKVDLKNTAVTDQPPAGVTLVSADVGTVSNNTWSYTIPSFTIGQTMQFNLTAKVDAYMAGNLVNTACVTAPEVNPSSPKCDTATVVVTPPTPTPPPPAPPVELPNTGAGNVVGIFSGVAIVSSLLYRAVLSRKIDRQLQVSEAE